MNIQQIAKLAGVSPATVSRVFSNHPGVSSEVRKRVLEVSAKHHYIPRVTSQLRNVVIITPYNSIYPVQSCVDMLLMALAKTLPEEKFRMEILPVNNLDRLEHVQFCGAVAIGCEASDFDDWEERFASPLIILDRPVHNARSRNICSVRSDEAQGMDLAIAALRRAGRKKIGCIIHGTPEHGNASIRRNAIEKSLAGYDFPVDNNLIVYSGDGSEKYVELIGKLLKRGVDALFCPGGNAGIMALYALSLYGKVIPDDIALIASEQTFFSCYAVPPQTTISPDYDGLARGVVQILNAYLNNASLTPEMILSYRLIERETL